MALASASERILAMEAALGTPLLLRERRGVRATAAGRTLVHHARIVLQQMERLRGELGAHGTGLSGHVRLFCNTSAMSEHLPRRWPPFSRRIRPSRWMPRSMRATTWPTVCAPACATGVRRVVLTDDWAARELVLCARTPADTLLVHARALLEHLAAG